jgi:polysaccharide biosynthesis protein PslJ
MKLIVGAADRGPIFSSAVTVGSLAVLITAVFTGLPLMHMAPVIAIIVVAAVAYRSLLAWRNLLLATIAIVLLIPIRRYEMPGNLPFELEPYRLVVAVIAVGWIASLLADPRVHLRRSVLDAPLALIALVAAGSVIANGERLHALGVSATVSKKLTFLISFFLVFYLLVSVIRHFGEVDFLVKTLVVGGAGIAALGLIEARTHVNVFNNLEGVVPLLELSTEIPTASDLSRGGQMRIYASAQHPIALGAVLAMLLPLAIYLAHTTSRLRWWLAALLLALGSVATISRTSILMLAVVALVFLWLRPLQTRRLWPLLIPAAIAIHIALPGALGSIQSSFFPEGGLLAEQRRVAGINGSGRLADIAPSLDEAAQKPVLGYGYGTRVVDGPKPNARILDNQWLGTLVETGFVGAAAWLWLFSRFVRRLAAAAKANLTERGWLMAAIAASVAAYAVGMFTYDAFSFIQVTFVLFILLGLGAALLANEPKTAEEAPAPV